MSDADKRRRVEAKFLDPSKFWGSKLQKSCKRDRPLAGWRLLLLSTGVKQPKTHVRPPAILGLTPTTRGPVLQPVARGIGP